MLAVERAEGSPALNTSLWSADADVFGSVDSREDMHTTLLALRAGDYVLCSDALGATRVKTELHIGARAASGLTLHVDHEGALAVVDGAADPAQRTTDPAFVEGLRSSTCLACHTSGRPSGN